MCTVSVIASTRSRRVRLAANRDELRTRPPAEPPIIRQFGERYAILPRDPVSGGTWIAVNDAGVAMTLLNVYATVGARLQSTVGAGRMSRGGIIPSLLAHADARSAAAEGACLPATRFPPFRLVIVDADSIADVRSNGHTLSADVRELGARPWMFASSGLGDELVEGPRRTLFETLVVGSVDSIAAQDAFHRHQWSDRPQISVCMSRAEARTVSRTVVDLGPAELSLTYCPEAPDRAVAPVRLTMARRQPIACH